MKITSFVVDSNSLRAYGVKNGNNYMWEIPGDIFKKHVENNGLRNVSVTTKTGPIVRELVFERSWKEYIDDLELLDVLLIVLAFKNIRCRNAENTD
jgi:hypothetical protein